MFLNRKYSRGLCQCLQTECEFNARPLYFQIELKIFRKIFGEVGVRVGIGTKLCRRESMSVNNDVRPDGIYLMEVAVA